MINKFLNNLKLRFLIWREEKKIVKQFDSIVTSNDIMAYHEDQASAAIAEGVGRIKNKINLNSLTPEYDMLTLANNNDGNQKTELLHDIYVTPEIPQEPMIDKRIQDYYELQRDKKQRAELRRKRKLN